MKSCKSADIAHMMIKEGSGIIKGVCCQKVVEAEAMVHNGVLDVLLANEIIGADKAARLAALAADPHHASVYVVVDSLLGVQQLQQAASDAGVVLGVLVEMDVGQRRCGVPTPEAAAELAQAVTKHSHLRFCGLQAYHGAAQHIRTWRQRVETVAAVSAKASQAMDAFKAAGVLHQDGSLHSFQAPQGVHIPADTPSHPCSLTRAIVTGGGTGTFPLEAASGVFTEVQPGSYIFNDADYARNGVAEGKLEQELPGSVGLLGDRAYATVQAAQAAVPALHNSAILGRGHGPQGAQEWGSLWEHSLFILATVMSRNTQDGYAVLDCGLKATSVDSGQPVLASGVAAMRTAAAGGAAQGGSKQGVLHVGRGVSFGVTTDEHSTLVVDRQEPAVSAALAATDAQPQLVFDAVLPPLGAKVLLVPGHCDPTVNLHDFLVPFSAPESGVHDEEQPLLPAATVQDLWIVHGRSSGY